MNGTKISSAPHPVPTVVRGKSPDSIHRARVSGPRERTPDLHGGSGGFGWHMIRHLTSHLTITPAPGTGKTIHAQFPR